MADDLLTRVRAVLETTPKRWETLTATLPAEMLTREPAPGEWSALSCLHHLLDIEREVFPVRVRAFLAGKDFPAFDPDRQGSAHSTSADDDPAALAAEFARVRQENLPLLDTITPADFARQSNHSELGPVTMEQMLNEWATHDLNHTIQGERAVMQPFLRETGPWRASFADHDAEAKR